jgi:hypothetical protein
VCSSNQPAVPGSPRISKPFSVVGVEVDRPGVGHALLAVVPHAAGDDLALLLEEEVAAVLGAWVHRLPAEQLAVEVLRFVGVGAEEVDPARRADDESWCRHGVLLLCRNSLSQLRLQRRLRLID